MIGQRIRCWLMIGAFVGLPWCGAAEETVHGADAVFRSDGLTIVWAVLRNPDESKTAIVVRVVDASKRFVALSVDGLDPFTKQRTALEAKRSLDGDLDVTIPRSRFADFPQSEFHFYGAASGAPGLTVYYLGVPDTTPEFGDQAKLEAYLKQTAR